VGVEKTAMIGRGISLAGDVRADSNLKVEGAVEGRSVQTPHDVEIAETGKVTANISAKVVRIAGEVTGDVAGSERVVIVRSGRVQGNIGAARATRRPTLFRGIAWIRAVRGATVRRETTHRGGRRQSIRGDTRSWPGA
jgi:cytoskeletal protein CcmA (bactofilin family)